MKTILLLIVILVASCSGHSNLDFSNSEPKNDWQREFLYGKVKELTQFKANYLNSENQHIENPEKEFKKLFSDYGKNCYSEYYNGDGKVRQSQKREYNSRNQMISYISEDYDEPSKIIESDSYDKNGNRIFSNVVMDDSIFFTSTNEIDSLHNITKQINVQNGDTTVIQYSYRYNDNRQIILILEKEISRIFTSEIITENKYNKNGQMIESVNKLDHNREMKSIFEYRGSGQLSEMSAYDSGQLKMQTSYDKNHNPVLRTYFENGLPEKELRFSYKFDSFDNWIEKKVEEKEDFKNDKGYLPIYIQKREIKYYQP